MESAKSRKKKNRRPALAEQADRHRLYELAVQYPESEVDFVDDTFRKLRRRHARLLREDFCGTANVCCEWVRRRRSSRAVGVDIDPVVMDWGRSHNLSRLSPAQARRVELVPRDVLKVTTEPPDIVLAMNFSYWLFKDRKQLKRYFRRVRNALAEGGIMFMDAYGGYDSFRKIEETKSVEDEAGNFTYIWEQEKYDPVHGRLVCHIHFAFPDGSRMERAFSYDWRLWTLPEVRELLDEVGFSRVTVYWQGWDADGEPDGIFLPVEEADADAGWICYITAEK